MTHSRSLNVLPYYLEASAVSSINVGYRSHRRAPGLCGEGACPAISRLFTVWCRRGTVERDRHRRRNRRVLVRPARHGAWPRSRLLPDSPHCQTGGCAERWSGPGPPSAVTARSPADLQRRPGSVGRSADRSVLTGSPGQQRAAARRPDSAASDPG